MKAELRQKWIEALRSGTFRQARGYLCLYDDDKDEYRHCCLGVLAEVVGAERENLLNAEILDDIGRGDLLGGWGRDAAYDPGAPLSHNTVQRKLAGLNDSDKSFAEIADWIEQNVPAENGKPVHG